MWPFGVHRLVERPDDVCLAGVDARHVREVLGQRPARDGDAVAVQQPGVEQHLQTAGVPPTRCRSYMTYLPPGFRSARCGTLSPSGRSRRASSSTSASRAIAIRCRHGVGRAAQRQHERVGVLQRLLRDDVARPDVLLEQPTALRAGRGTPRVLRGETPGCDGVVRAATCPSPRWRWPWCWRCTCRRRSRARDRPRTRPCGRPSRSMLPGLELPDRLEDGDDVDVLAVRPIAGQDAAAVDEDARHVQPGHRHDAAGHVLVAAAEGEQAVVVHAAGDDFDANRR